MSELPLGRMSHVRAFGRDYAICNVDGIIFAVEGICPHRGAPLAHGALHQHTIVCPWHAWEFDCRTGAGDCADIATIPVTIIGDQIYLNAGTARS